MGCALSVPAAADSENERPKSAADPAGPQGRAIDEGAAEVPSETYCGAPCPLNEPTRIKYLQDLDILDTEPDPRFDNITKICCTVFKVPIALVSLVDSDRQWFKSAAGIDAKETDRTSSFCAWTLLPEYPEALVVEDTLLDARFKHNKLVQGFPFIRFYAGCPLVCSNSIRLGSLCLIDREPRTFDAESCALLASMAEMVVRLIEAETQVKVVENHKPAGGPAPEQDGGPAPKQDGAERPWRSTDSQASAVMLVDTDQDAEWTILFANDPCQKLLGRGADDFSNVPFWSVFQAVDASGAVTSGAATWIQRGYHRAISMRCNFQLRVMYSRGASGALRLPSGGGAADGGRRLRELHDVGPDDDDDGGGGGGGGELMIGLLEFGFAPSAGVDGCMPLIGIPNSLPAAERPLVHYFATLQELGPAPDRARRRHGGGDGGAQRDREGQLASARCSEVEIPSMSMSGGWASGGMDSRASTGSGTGSRSHGAYRLVPNNDACSDIQLGMLLGKGSFGRVYRGMWQGVQVAVKVIEYEATDGDEEAGEADDDDGPARGASGPPTWQSVQLESLLQQRVDHPNVVQTFKLLHRARGNGNGPDPPEPPAGADGGAAAAPAGPRRRVMEAWLVLEFCNRGCVAGAISKGWFQRQRGTSSAGPLAAPIVRTAREIADAVGHLHAQGILHGDLTSSNVLLAEHEAEGDPRGYTAKVGDFGLSRAVAADGPMRTRTYGTVTHMAPELLLEGKISKAADVYSFGVVLWEMLTGRRPFAGLTHGQVLHVIAQGQRLELPASPAGPLYGLLRSCLSEPAEARPTFDQVVEQLTLIERQLI